MRTPTGYKQKSRHKMSETERTQVRQWVSLKRMSTEQLLEKLKLVPKKLEGTIARMLWWDFQSNNLWIERSLLWDQYLQFDPREETDPPSKEELARCLKRIGYPEYRIKLRLMAF